jgi:hypothetical protein
MGTSNLLLSSSSNCYFISDMVDIRWSAFSINLFRLCYRFNIRLHCYRTEFYSKHDQSIDLSFPTSKYNRSVCHDHKSTHRRNYQTEQRTQIYIFFVILILSSDFLQLTFNINQNRNDIFDCHSDQLILTKVTIYVTLFFSKNAKKMSYFQIEFDVKSKTSSEELAYSHVKGRNLTDRVSDKKRFWQWNILEHKVRSHYMRSRNRKPKKVRECIWLLNKM